MLTLYDYFRSSACFRVRIALNLKQCAYQTIPIHLLKNGGEQHTESYRNVNPQALVPTLDDDGVLITQSLAIIEYLEECYPTPPLLPHDPQQKAQVRAFALAIAADLHPLNNLRVLNYLEHDLHLTEEYKSQWYHHWMTTGLSALEKMLSAQPKQPFCFGKHPSLADICLVPQLFNARRFQCDLSAFPTLVRIDAHCQQEEAFAKALPVEVAA